MSTTAGLHVPVYPLSEVEGKVGTVPPTHKVIPVPKLKEGMVLGVTVMVNVVVVAHCPDAGVNV